MTVETTTPAWPLALNERAARAAHLGIKAEDLETARDYEPAAHTQTLADHTRRLLLRDVWMFVAGDVLAADYDEGAIEYRASRLTGDIMRAAYAAARAKEGR